MGDLSFEEIENREAQKDPQRDVIRVQTDRWVDCHGQLIIKKTIRQMRSMSESKRGYLAFEDELSQMGADVCDSSLAGIEGLEDGIYEIFLKWSSTDYETGHVDDVEFGFRKIES